MYLASWHFGVLLFLNAAAQTDRHACISSAEQASQLESCRVTTRLHSQATKVRLMSSQVDIVEICHFCLIMAIAPALRLCLTILLFLSSSCCIFWRPPILEAPNFAVLLTSSPCFLLSVSEFIFPILSSLHKLRPTEELYPARECLLEEALKATQHHVMVKGLSMFEGGFPSRGGVHIQKDRNLGNYLLVA